MAYQPPLHVHLLYHPSSSEASALAAALARKLMAPPGAHGLRLPVFLVPDLGDGLPPSLGSGARWMDAAEHTAVVLFVDADMNRRNAPGTGDQWAAFVNDLRKCADPGRHHVTLVALDEQAFELDEALSELNFLQLAGLGEEERIARVTFELAVRCLLLLRRQALPTSGESTAIEAPVSLFLSHAKADLDEQRMGPVHRVLEAVSERRVHSWYDARAIQLSEEFTDAIRKGIRDADLMVVFQTDSWAQSEWCRMEAMYAKEVATPILVVDALEEGEVRRFPYGGNARTLRWHEVGAASDDGGDALAQRRRQQAERLIERSVLETLRRAHTLRQMEGQAGRGDVALDTAPEAAHLAFHPEATSFLYPDPPLTMEEYGVLRRLRQGASFETPLMRIAQQLPVPRSQPIKIAVSVSDSDVLAEYGLLSEHLRHLTDEIHLYLLMAGLQVVYGGRLDPDHLDDEDNFTVRLFKLVRGYRGLAKQVGQTLGEEVRLAPVLNAAPWPLWCTYDDQVEKVFGSVASLDRRPCPELGFPPTQLEALDNGFVVPNTPLHQYAWGVSMTAMREYVTQQTAARLVIGGKIEGYQGRYAGLIEEPLISLRRKHPLFLIGALGGCTRLVIDLLCQEDREEMTTDRAREKVANYDALVELYQRHGQLFLSREEVAGEIKGYGSKGPKAALNNGLEDDENLELFACTDPRRAAELVLTGLSKLATSGAMTGSG